MVGERGKTGQPVALVMRCEARRSAESAAIGVASDVAHFCPYRKPNGLNSTWIMLGGEYQKWTDFVEAPVSRLQTHTV